MANVKLRLPDFRTVQIGCVLNANSDLKRFLNCFTVAKLKLLRFNYFSHITTATKASFYIRSLSKIVRATTKQVSLFRLELNEEELEQIIKASCNTDTLIFEMCDIHCSTALDFGSSLKYKMKILSFQFWGNTFDPDRKADWKFDPTCFNNIIEAISNSGLRNSLQNICIACNLTLDKEKVRQVLTK